MQINFGKPWLNITLIVTVILAGMSFAQPGFAQNASVPTPVEEQRKPTDPATWKEILDKAAKAVESKDVPESVLNEIVEKTTIVREDSARKIDELQPRLDELSQQISELGKEPAEGEPAESPEAQKRRASLNEQFAEVDAHVKAARLALVRAQQIQKSVVQTRQSKFFRSISVRSKGIFTIGFWTDFFEGMPGFASSFQFLVHEGYKIAMETFGSQPWKIGLLPMLLLLVAYVFVRTRRYLGSLVIQDNPDNQATIYRSRFIEFCRSGLLPAVVIFLVYRILTGVSLLTPRLGEFVASLGVITAFYIMSVAMVRIILLPKEGRSRILRINDLPARRIVHVLITGLGIASVIAVFNAAAIVLIARLSIAVGFSFLFAITVAVTFIMAVWIVYKDRNYIESLSAIVEYSGTWRLAKICVQVSSAAILFSALFGYIAFAEFLAQQLIFGLLVIGTVWLILRFVHNMTAPETGGAGQQAGYTGVYGEGENAQSGQFAILATGLLTLALYLAASILLLLPWGYRTSDFYQVVQSVFFGFEIGGLRISVSTILIVVGLFVVGYMITISLRNWLNNKLLPTTRLDVGVSNSISTVFGYIGFVLAAILAVSVAGFDLSNLAIVAGALSVGVGFGLQSIVNNFVSGLILLAERPIKAGDWIVTSGGEGTVTKISVRSTEIETFDRATVIIPNSTLITDNVTNWTHDNKTGRIIIPVGVGYGSDVEKVKQILIDCAKAHRLVLGRPEPHVFFVDFGANSLDFQLRCFLADINNCMLVSSELRFAILAALREAEIEIPFPQTDIHIRSGLLQTGQEKSS